MQVVTKEDRVDKCCFYIILFDILFLPLFPLVSVSMSLPVMAYWYLTRGKRTHYLKEYRALPFVVSLMAISVLLGALVQWDVRWETTIETSIKRFFQFLTSFWYFLFFEYYFIKYNKKIAPYLFWFIVYVAVLALFYQLFQDKFMEYKTIINPADPHTRRFLEGSLYGVYRYTFLWADANNVAYALGGVTYFFLLDKEQSIAKKYISIVLLAYILLCTMSIGGILVSFAMLGVAFVFSNAIRLKGNGLFISIVVIAIITYIVAQNSSFIMDIYEEGTASRFERYSDSSNMSGGRLADLQRTLPLMSPLFILVGSGLEGFTSENGHLYLICMYGFFVYVYFLFVLFRKRNGVSWVRFMALLPFFIGFTMNIAIIEQKYMLILMLVGAHLSAESYRNRHKMSC